MVEGDGAVRGGDGQVASVRKEAHMLVVGGISGDVLKKLAMSTW